MKKSFILILLAVLLCVLSGCSSGSDSVPEATAAPETAESSGQVQHSNDAPAAMPVLDPESTIVPNVDPADYSYNSFFIEENGFYMEYPAHWERQPASRSLCFVEPVSPGEIPGRLVVSSKKLEEVTNGTRESQLRSFFKNILGDFDSYEWSDIYTSQPFLGDDQALSVTYSATKGEAMYKGYVIIGIRNSTVYAYHFRCAESNYAHMQNVMIRTRDAVTLKPID